MRYKYDLQNIGHSLTVNPAATADEYIIERFVLGDHVVAFSLSSKGRIGGKLSVIGGGTPAEILHFLTDGRITTARGEYISEYSEKPVSLAVAFRSQTRRYDIYVENTLAVKDFECPRRVTFDKCVSFSLDLKSADSASVTLKDIDIYPAYEKSDRCPITYPDSRPPVRDKVIAPTGKTTIPSDERERKMLSDASAIHLRSGVILKNGIKHESSPLPFEKDGEIMIPAKSLELLLGTRVEKSKSSVTIGDSLLLSDGILKRNGAAVSTAVTLTEGDTLYLPLLAIAKALSLTVSRDPGVIHGGTVILSEGKIDLPTDAAGWQALNNYCFFERPSAEKILSDYQSTASAGEHPRLLLDKAGFDRLSVEIKENPIKAHWYKTLLSHADRLSAEPPIRYEILDGVRLMYISNHLVTRMTVLAMAYRLSRNEKYLTAALLNVRAAAEMPDWNPSHHIDVGIMAYGFAIAYDWLYEFLSDSDRALLERGGYNNCLWTVSRAIEDSSTPYGTVLMSNNHNVYVNAGNVALALALLDVYPTECSELLSGLFRAFECFSDKFAPDGQYYEGPHYSTIAIEFQVRMLAVIESTLGKLYSLDRTHGFDKSFEYVLKLQSDVSAFNFADGNPGLVNTQGIFWLYSHYGIKGMKDALANGFYRTPKDTAVAECLAFYDVSPESGECSVDLDAYYPTQEIITMRDGFSEGQTFVGIKAGDTVYAHSHLDSGSFVFDSMGTRWASDMGADSYNLPDYWDSRCRRWYVFLCCAEAHNTVVINPDEKPAYVLGSTAPVTHYEKSTDGVLVRIDTTNLYGAERGVSSSSRSYLFTDQRKSLVLRDEIKLTGKACVYWLLYTDKDAEVTESGFVLTDKQHPEKKLKVELRSSHGMTLGIEAAVAFPEGPKLEGQKTNDNYRRLYCRIDIPEGKREDLSITAKLTPFGIEATDVDEYDRPSSTWSL